MGGGAGGLGRESLTTPDPIASVIPRCGEDHLIPGRREHLIFVTPAFDSSWLRSVWPFSDKIGRHGGEHVVPLVLSKFWSMAHMKPTQWRRVFTVPLKDNCARLLLLDKQLSRATLEFNNQRRSPFGLILMYAESGEFCAADCLR